jgi:hypothetical protein
MAGGLTPSILARMGALKMDGFALPAMTALWGQTSRRRQQRRDGNRNLVV